MPYQQETQVGIAAVTAAARLCQQVRAAIPTAMEKEDRSPVTVADYGSQAIVCQALAAAFPDDPVVGEEDATELREPANAEILSRVTGYVREQIPTAAPEAVADWIDRGNGSVAPRYWTLDPIDGTKGFLRGDQYAIALALVEGGDLKVGILACPALPIDLRNPEGPAGLLFVAVRGEGTQMMPLGESVGLQVKVVTPENVDNYRFAESVEASHGDRGLQAAIAEKVGFKSPPARLDSQAKYGVVASGQAALYLRLPSPKSPDYREKIWDHAAGALVVEEAGGRVTDMFGKPLDFASGAKMENNRGVVASSGSLHDAVIAALAER